MILITGGAYAGKTDYVMQTFAVQAEEIIDGRFCSFEAVMTAKCIRNYHLLVRRLLADGQNPVAFTEMLLCTNPDAVVIQDEIGCGIVPIEKEERLWREQVGWCGCLLAEHAEQVIRVCCGCASVIKEKIV